MVVRWVKQCCAAPAPVRASATEGTSLLKKARMKGDIALQSYCALSPPLQSSLFTHHSTYPEGTQASIRYQAIAPSTWLDLDLQLGTGSAYDEVSRVCTLATNEGSTGA